MERRKSTDRLLTLVKLSPLSSLILPDLNPWDFQAVSLSFYNWQLQGRLLSNSIAIFIFDVDKKNPFFYFG